MSNATAIELHALAADAAGATGDAVDIGELATAARLTLRAYAITGASPIATALTGLIETSPDDSAYRTVREFTLTTANANSVQSFTVGGLQRYVRVRYTVAGTTPSIAWSLDGEAHVIYLELDDISRYGAPRVAFKKFEDAELLDACIAVSSDADDYISGAFELPLSAWGESLKKNCAALAAALLFRRKGCDGSQLADKPIFDAEKLALDWFAHIKDGTMRPPDIVDSTAEDEEGGSFIVSNRDRGWDELS